MELRLRGGSEPGQEPANAETTEYATQESYHQPAQTEYAVNPYESSQAAAAAAAWPAEPASTYSQPTYQAPPVPQAQQYVPPPVPSAYQTQAYVPSAPASYAAPATGYAPAPAKANWDHSSLSFTRRFIDLFGWENISPIFYLVLGLSVATIRAIMANGGEDDEFQLLTDPSIR